MSNSAKKTADQAEREKVKKRYSNRREPDVIYPAKKQVDFYDADIHQRVAVYVRVSTDNLGQETSYELQKNYYEEFVLKHPNWKLVKIYADKGISGTSTKHRVELNQMLADSRDGKIDLIITKSVSRLARNTVDCITIVRNLAELRNPVGVFFESECIFSLNEDTNMPLSFLASIAENESRIRSRSMEVSLAQRLNGGLPLTPKLLGYSHDADGKLVINPDEAPTVKLIFYMYLSGYSSSYIAKTLETLGKRTFLGNSKWTSGTVIQVLRNERHCGDVLTRKTWTPDVISHKSKKNRGERQQSLYKGEHEAIVSRDDYIAVQHMINNAKYGGKSILPELRVIDSGILKGFVTISPKWAGFKAADYLQASMSVYTDDTYYGQPAEGNPTFEVEAGDFDLRGFEVTNTAALHCQPLLLRHAEAFVVVICQFTVLRGIVRGPVAGIIAALAALDTNELTGTGEGGEAQFRQSLRQIGLGRILFRRLLMYHFERCIFVLFRFRLLLLCLLSARICPQQCF